MADTLMRGSSHRRGTVRAGGARGLKACVWAHGCSHTDLTVHSSSKLINPTPTLVLTVRIRVLNASGNDL